MNPSTAFATVVVDELVRCGLREAVIAPGSRSAPLAMALHAASSAGPLRLHVRIDERSAAFLALGLAKAAGRPAVVVCTSGTAAAHFHAAVIEADEACVPLIVLTADRPPELRGTGANQTIDQIKLYGNAVRWFCETGAPEDRPGQVGYWRSLASRAWAVSSGNALGTAGPVHLNVPLREPLVPDSGEPERGRAWPEPLDGRPGGAPWTVFSPARAAGEPTEIDWTERGIVICGDGAADGGALASLAAAAGWPLLAEPSSAARRGPVALCSYQYLLDSARFMDRHRPDLIISAGRPGLSRGQLSVLRAASGASVRHVIVAQARGRWADPGRSGTEVVTGLRLRTADLPRRRSPRPSWLESWLAADAAASAAANAVLDGDDELSEPLLARELAAALSADALLWVASSMPARDLDRHMAPRDGLRVLANRGTSGIDGLVSASIGAALAHQAAGGGPAAALLGDLALLHDAPGLLIGPAEPRPDLCLVIVNNDGGGIFSGLEQAAFPDSFERVFATPHGTNIEQLAGAAGLPYRRLDKPLGLRAALAGPGLHLVEVQTDRSAGAKLRAAIAQACSAAVDRVI